MAEFSALKLPTLGPKGKTPTERTLSYLRGLGLHCWMVERRLKFNKTVDLFHIIDIIALTPTGVMGVQSTGSDFAGHKQTLLVTRRLWTERWLATPGTSLMLIGWRRVKQGTGGRMIWAPRIEMITQDKLYDAQTS